MDVKTAIALASIVLAVLSLIVSGMLALRHTRTTMDGYALPVVLKVFSQFRTQEFFDAQQYVFEELPRQPVQPYTDLPLEDRSQIRTVAGLYDDLGKLVAHGIVKEELIIGSNGMQARRIWEAVEPFVREERAQRSSNLWIYLEDLAHRTTRRPPAAIHERLKLHRYAGPQRPSPPASPASGPAPSPAPSAGSGPSPSGSGSSPSAVSQPSSATEQLRPAEQPPAVRQSSPATQQLRPAEQPSATDQPSPVAEQPSPAVEP